MCVGQARCRRKPPIASGGCPACFRTDGRSGWRSRVKQRQEGGSGDIGLWCGEVPSATEDTPELRCGNANVDFLFLFGEWKRS